MSGWVIAILIGLGLLVIGGIVATIAVGVIASDDSATGFSTGGAKVAVIHISGIIRDGGQDLGLFGGVTLGARETMSQLRQAGKDKDVKAVLLRINSPGGSAAASQAIYAEIERLRDKHNKPVVASMGDTAASGGYYVASAADKIVANAATVTGSIGVIMESINWSGLAEKYGVKGDTIVSGPNKDGFNPFRPMRDDERKLFQAIVDDVYDQFVTDVAKGRKELNKSRVRKLADGRVFTGRQAKKAGLVDEIGNYQDALLIAARAGGIRDEEPKVKTYGRSRGLYGLLSERVVIPVPSAGALPIPAPLGPGIWMVWGGHLPATPK